MARFRLCLRRIEQSLMPGLFLIFGDLRVFTLERFELCIMVAVARPFSDRLSYPLSGICDLIDRSGLEIRGYFFSNRLILNRHGLRSRRFFP
ncbi:hypothetical protein AA23498_2591 [Acetobacter nitrogenifigens DSM 23921 = NBRC 105050]|uniref:Uncharacterized protein n=1 Tax=Acetobacter nitrogenifigens DSM 23921 = NBRC 105050 TaxID=1120919 RepID=A0A511X627_9PROT|nr:hypothetical protein AA23498_2591 [Acetobacter nitrogenifigens DSM 23921 = NBRC 105050]GEN58390.1 hypothetical protein ANI02nite_02740 [Acetobacter nitrogenifigens DSM 23921 = NBRC 105050]